ncbi:MAG: hypothetical protein Q9160_005281 [Pyrenula sp. 1 TL-2023]
MYPSIFITSLIIQGWLSDLSSAAALERRDLSSGAALVRRDRTKAEDCGSWTMYCAGNTNKADTAKQDASGACNNACYWIQCMEKISLTEGPKGSDDKPVRQSKWQTKYAGGGVDHRMDSGCTLNNGQANAKSVCTNFPWSQQFNDMQDIALASTGQPSNKVPANPANKPIGDDYRSCDEFPMNEMDPVPKAAGNTAYASLRCMPQKQNEEIRDVATMTISLTSAKEGGRQLSTYITKGGSADQAKYAYPQPRRDMNKCPDTDKLFLGDQFKPEFDGVDETRSPYCEIPKNEADRVRICKTNNDGQQYYLTNKEGSGKASMPYRIDTDNRYAVHEGENTNSPKELQQCQVVVERDINTSKKSDEQFYAKITVSRTINTGGTNGYKEIGDWDTKDKCPPKANAFDVTLTGMPEVLKVTFPPGGNTKDPIQNPVNFAYGVFSWTSKSEGLASSMNDITQKGVATSTQGFKADKSYCYGKSKKPNEPEEISTESGGKVKSQVTTCFFPCFPK